MSPGDGTSLPLPQAAFERWLAALAEVGWPAQSRPGGPGDAGLAGGVSTAGSVRTGGRVSTGGGRHSDVGSETVAVGDALGRVTTVPVAARWPSPRTDCAAMDGIAVRAADLAVAYDGELTTGDVADQATGVTVRLPAGTFEWIDTGDPMPDGPDTVVVRERLLPQADGSVIVTLAGTVAVRGEARKSGTGSGGPWGLVRRGQHVRQAGEDFAAGEVLVPAGLRLRPGDLAAAAAGGHAAVTVARRPVVAVIPTGDEVRPVGSVPGRGDIIDTNSLMIAARCRQLGTVPLVSAIVPDEPDALAAELRRAAAEADLVLVIAGSSRGRGDHAASVLAQVGGVAVAGVAVRPGHPVLLGHAKRPDARQASADAATAGTAGTSPEQAREPGRAGYLGGIAPVIGLPGYPLAAAVTFELFAVPMLGALTGRTVVPDRVHARLDRDWSSPANVEDWVLVTLTPDPAGGAPCATPARRGAGSISQLARADAWWPIPAGQGTYAAGSLIDVLPFPGG